MTAHSDVAFQRSDMMGLFSKYGVLFVLLTFLFAVLGLVTASLYPRQYKAHFVVAIDSRYFQNPLTHEFIPEVNDPIQLKSESVSLVSRTLTPVFLDTLGEKYGMYQPPKPTMELPADLAKGLAQLTAFVHSFSSAQAGEKERVDPSAPRQALLKRITIVNVNDTTFDIGLAYSDPGVTYQASQDMAAQIVQSLSEDRTRNLVTLRDAIRKQLQWLSFNVATSSPEATSSSRPELIHEELTEVRAQIRALSEHYTDQHPKLQELRGREQTLTSLLAASSRTSSQSQNPVVGGESREDIRAMSNDLLTKMNYLNIALESDKGHPMDYVSILQNPVYPAAPSGPSKTVFALGGALLGFFVSLFFAAIREYFHQSTLHAEALAHQLDIPLLGKLPAVAWKDLKAEERN